MTKLSNHILNKSMKDDSKKKNKNRIHGYPNINEQKKQSILNKKNKTHIAT